MAFPLLLVLGAALGAKKQQDEQKEFQRQKQIQAETTRMSPWTGMRASAPVAPKGVAANVGGGALSGWAMQQGMNSNARPGLGYDIQNTEALQPTAPALMDSSLYRRNGLSAWPYLNGMYS